MSGIHTLKRALTKWKVFKDARQRWSKKYLRLITLTCRDSSSIILLMIEQYEVVLFKFSKSLDLLKRYNLFGAEFPTISRVYEEKRKQFFYSIERQDLGIFCQNKLHSHHKSTNSRAG